MLRQLKGALAKNTRAGIALDGARAGLARVRKLNDGRLSLAVRVLAVDAVARNFELYQKFETELSSYILR